MPEVSISSGGDGRARPIPSYDVATAQGTYLGYKIDLFKIAPASATLAALPAHTIITSNRERDIVVLQARVEQLEKEEKTAGAELAAAVLISRGIALFSGPVFSLGTKDPGVQTFRSVDEALQHARSMEGKPLPTGVQFNPRSAAATGLASAAQLGAIGTAVQYIKANSALDAQRQELERLQASVANGTAITISQEAQQLQVDANEPGNRKAAIESPTAGEGNTSTGKLVAGPKDPSWLAG